MQILTGIAVSPGVAIAEAVVLDAEELRIPRRTVATEEKPSEIERIDQAIAKSIDDLRCQREDVRGQLGHDAADVFNWHIGVLEDRAFRGSIVELIETKAYAAAYATSTVMRNHQRRFMKMTDPVLAERIRDVQDIERRLLRNLLGSGGEDLAHLAKEVVLVAHDLSMSQTAQLTETKVVGVALDVGGPTSHTSILLRTWGRPAVVGLKNLSSLVSGGDLLIVDGVNRLVVTNPDDATLHQYRDQQARYVQLTSELELIRDLPAVTQDDVHVHLMANIEYPDEAEVCREKGADGIGLYRTEFLFLGETMPDEDAQHRAYRQAIAGAQGKPVTIRTFDLGADKITQQRSVEREPNPMLGNRSIRYSLQNLDMFKVQLRAILRAATEGHVRLMFPLITSLLELRQAKMSLLDAREDLEEAGIPFGRDIEVGMMIETPAAAVQCREFAREVQFVSIGTNDLIQYMLAVDRGNERVSPYYSPTHPAVVRAIRDVIRTCARAGVDCSLCGEMAGEPLYTLLLIGLGLRSLSMAPSNIPEVKKLIRACTIAQAQRVARRALTFDTDRQVTNYLRAETKKILPDDPI